MKKVLILAYDFPPYNSMGSQRPYAWYKYFKEFNIYPIVVTRHWGDSYKNAIDYIKASTEREVSINTTEFGTIINVPYTPNYRDKLILKYGLESRVLLRKIATILYTFLQYAIFAFDSRKGIYEAADDYLKNNKVDYILATGEPFVMLRYGSKLAKKHSIPWIADYRDCWSLDLYLLENKYRFIEKYIYTLFEKHYVKSSSIITTVAPLYQSQLQTLFPKKKIEIIQNGFFEEEYSNLNIENQNKDAFTIAYGGTIYPFHTLEIFLEGLKLVIKKDPTKKIKAYFYGSNFDLNQKERIIQNSQGIEDYLVLTDRLNRTSLFENYSNASCLLIFDNKQMISGKLYEYLPFNKMILMAGKDDGPIEKIINDTSSGIVCGNPQELANALEKLYDEWINIGKVNCYSKNIEHYSRRFQTKKLADLFSTMT